MTTQSVAVLGGYGVFGSRIVRSLARHAALDVLIAGRDLSAAQRLVESIASPRLQAMRFDMSSPADVRSLLALRPAIVIDTVGPFQRREPELAQQCAESGSHYIDIADDRRWVAGIGVLDAIAKRSGVAIVSGASTVPAITTAFVDDLAPDPQRIERIEVGISPGHRAPRGLATVKAILSYCGRPIPPLAGSTKEYGWGGLQRHRYPAPLGSRWLSHVDTPERSLWCSRYAALRHGQVQAGLELSALHLGLSLLSRGVRARCLPSLDRWAAMLLGIANALDGMGEDAGGMHVQVDYRDSGGQRRQSLATLIAERGDGPQIPATPAALIAKKLLALPGYVPLTARGAMPCMGLVTRAEILDELKGFAIRYQVTRD